MDIYGSEPGCQRQFFDIGVMPYLPQLDILHRNVYGGAEILKQDSTAALANPVGNMRDE